MEQAEAAEEASAANGEGGGGGGSSLLANSSNTILIPTPLNHQQDSPLYGNLALTSCPGKKVRLSTGK